MEIIDN